jgi:hypothetical protein
VGCSLFSSALSTKAAAPSAAAPGGAGLLPEFTLTAAAWGRALDGIGPASLRAAVNLLRRG